jgi:hypothetical protein
LPKEKDRKYICQRRKTENTFAKGERQKIHLPKEKDRKYICQRRKNKGIINDVQNITQGTKY